MKQGPWQILCNQVLNAAIVGGIAGVAALTADAMDGGGLSQRSCLATVLAFGMAFLVKLAAMRGVK